MISLDELRANLDRVRERMAAAARRSGRPEDAVSLLAVTKTHPQECVLLARRAGLRLFGENRVQEAVAKYGPLLDAGGARGPGPGTEPAPELELHLIGHLQRNKARQAAGLFACVQSIDKLETAEALARACGEAGREMDVLLELNTSEEPGKFGFAADSELLEAVEPVRRHGCLRLRGLMTVGPLTEDAGRVRRAFARLRALYERLRPQLPGFDVLSMGMSGDFELAIEEGSTMVRLGTVLFGPRS